MSLGVYVSKRFPSMCTHIKSFYYTLISVVHAELLTLNVWWFIKTGGKVIGIDFTKDDQKQIILPGVIISESKQESGDLKWILIYR